MLDRSVIMPLLDYHRWAQALRESCLSSGSPAGPRILLFGCVATACIHVEILFRALIHRGSPDQGLLALRGLLGILLVAYVMARASYSWERSREGLRWVLWLALLLAGPFLIRAVCEFSYLRYAA